MMVRVVGGLMGVRRAVNMRTRDLISCSWPQAKLAARQQFRILSLALFSSRQPCNDISASHIVDGAMAPRISSCHTHDVLHQILVERHHTRRNTQNHQVTSFIIAVPSGTLNLPNLRTCVTARRVPVQVTLDTQTSILPDTLRCGYLRSLRVFG